MSVLCLFLSLLPLPFPVSPALVLGHPNTLQMVEGFCMFFHDTYGTDLSW